MVGALEATGAGYPVENVQKRGFHGFSVIPTSLYSFVTKCQLLMAHPYMADEVVAGMFAALVKCVTMRGLPRGAGGVARGELIFEMLEIQYFRHLRPRESNFRSNMCISPKISKNS